ncbi:hypothetical protein [Streptomyces sp. NPDC026659]|uniref:hypothetical protein n=1 Tax=Streptomyces sp. NPDC026659 TaxID=3155123 RepID=UPI0034028B82
MVVATIGKGGDLTPRLSAAIVIMEDMSNPNLTTGSIWRLRDGGQEIARLTVTGTDMPWSTQKSRHFLALKSSVPSSVSKSGLPTRRTGSGPTPATPKSAMRSP